MKLKEAIHGAISMVNKTVDQSLSVHTLERTSPTQIPSTDPQSLAASLISLVTSVTSEISRSHRAIAVAEDQARTDSAWVLSLSLRTAALERDLGEDYCVRCYLMLYVWCVVLYR